MFKKPNKKPKSKHGPPGEEQVVRIILPKESQVLGVVEQRLGASRMNVRCLDGKPRVCRIPGRLKRRLWVRESDVVIVEPWEFGGDEKGDIVLKYTKPQVNVLRKKGYLKKIEDFEEF